MYIMRIYGFISLINLKFNISNYYDSEPPLGTQQRNNKPAGEIELPSRE